MRRAFPAIAIHPLLYTFLFMASCNGQDNAQRSTNVGTTDRDTAQISEYIVNAFEDRQGNLWFGTMSDGAVRWDGKTLTYITTDDGLCGNTVASIAQDKEGNMWFGTHTGASWYDGSTFTNFTEAGGLHGAGCQILVTRDGNIWAGTNHGVFRYNGSSFSGFDLPRPDVEVLSYKWEAGKVWRLIEDSKGNIWFATDGFGVCRYDGNTFTHFTRKDGLCSNNVCGMVEDAQGNIWFGSLSSDLPEYVNEGGLSRYDGKTFTKFPDIEGLHENDIYAIYKERSGNIWIGAVGLGAYRYDPSESLRTGVETFTLFDRTDRPDLTTNFGVQGFVEDRNGTLWFGFSGGLFRFNESTFVNVTKGGPWTSP